MGKHKPREGGGGREEEGKGREEYAREGGRKRGKERRSMPGREGGREVDLTIMGN